MKFTYLFNVGFYLAIAVMTMFNIVDMSKALHIIMALSLVWFFAKEALEVAE